MFVAEIGDVTRFASPRHLCSWAGLTPRHRESDTTVHRGPITKQGSTLVRWAAVEAAQNASRHRRVGWSAPARRSPPGAAATSPPSRSPAKLLTLVYYGLRDGHIRALTATTGTGAA